MTESQKVKDELAICRINDTQTIPSRRNNIRAGRKTDVGYDGPGTTGLVTLSVRWQGRRKGWRHYYRDGSLGITIVI